MSEAFPKLTLKVRDNLDELAEELTRGTKLPFNYARETLKMVLLAGLPKDGQRPVMSWFPKLHRRQYLILLSETPGTGKGETFRRVRATAERAAEENPGLPWFHQFILGDGLGSPQWACVVLGGERAKKGTVLQKPGKSDVQIDQPGRLVHYDEGKRLLQQDTTGKTERGLITMYTQLFESNEHSMGSFENGSAAVYEANVSLMLHFTRAGFEAAFTGSGATSGGFLSRCVLIAEEATPIRGDWRAVSPERVRDLVGMLQECATRKELAQEDGVDAVRQQCLDELAQADPLHAARLQFLFAQDLYARGMFSKEGVITEYAARQAWAWTRHQRDTRAALWPLDQSADKNERVYIVLRNAFAKQPEMTFRDMKKACHTDRAGSGGILTLNAALRGMKAAGEVISVGRNARNFEVFRWVG